MSRVDLPRRNTRGDGKVARGVIGFDFHGHPVSTNAHAQRRGKPAIIHPRSTPESATHEVSDRRKIVVVSGETCGATDQRTSEEATVAEAAAATGADAATASVAEEDEYYPPTNPNTTDAAPPDSIQT